MTSRRQPDVKKGRPTKYRSNFDGRVYRLALLGLTDAEIAECLEVAESTLNLWKQQHESFSESITRGKIDADARVADSLYNRAVGYSHEEEKIFCHEGVITTYETTKHYPPDTAAASLWLRNRQPQKWRDKVEHVLDPGEGNTLLIVGAKIDLPEGAEGI